MSIVFNMSASKPAQLTMLILMVASTNSLECGILLNDTGKNLSQVITTCLIPTIPVVEEKLENVTVVMNTTSEDDPEEPETHGPRRGLRIRRETPNKTTSTTTTNPLLPVSKHNGNKHNVNEAAKCVVHCIMTSYNMIGSKGYPELTGVAASLIKGIRSRELRDFLQDSVDECFQQLSESVDLDSCTYSARLATCLADKARFNCVEWPVGELPFPHKF